jgi:phage recombination protein Bet
MAEKNLPAVQTEQKEVTYTAADGQEIKLTMDMVRKYLVQGHGNLVTVQEMVFFLNICRSRKLNPFIKDCYLIKYSEGDPAAIVTSVDYFRKRARAQKDCKGWRSGIIVAAKDGNTKDTAGLILDNETLLGGWFEAKPDGWTDPLRLEVNLRGYIKKKKDGSITRFWSPENQPSQIQKVAESQGLRKLWPDEFQGIYSEEEITQLDRSMALDIKDDVIEEKNPQKLIAVFDASMPAKADRTLVDEYLTRVAAGNMKTVDEIKAAAASDPKELDNLWKLFPAWCKQQKAKKAKEDQGKEPQKTDANGFQELSDNEMAPEPCPVREDQAIMRKSFCDKCTEREGCPAWAVVDQG